MVPTSPEEDLPRGIDDVRQVQQQVGYDREELHYAPRGAVNTPPEVRGDRIYEQQQQRGYGFRRRQEEIDLRVLVGDELLHQRPGVGNFEGLYSTSTPQAAPSPVAVAYMQETMYDRGR